VSSQGQSPLSQPGEPEAPAGEPQPDHVLAEGGLHPLSLFPRMLPLFGRMLPVVLVIGAQMFMGDDRSGSVGSVVAFGLLVVPVVFVAGYLEYRRYHYRLTTRELQIVHGILSRHERRIPIDRIQDLGSEQTLLRRMLGLETVTVETASGEGAEAKIDAIGPEQAELLREALGRAHRFKRPQASESGPTGTEAAGQRPATLVFRTSPLALLLRGLTDNRAGLILVAAAWVLDLIQDVRGAELVDQVLPMLAGVLDDTNLYEVALTIVLGLLAVFAVGWVLSAGATLVHFYGFTLSERDEVFQRRFGLLTTHTYSMPRRRIQCLRLEQSWLRRLVGLIVLRADNAGSAGEQSQEQASRSTFVPAAFRGRAQELVTSVFPDVGWSAIRFRRVSAKMMRRYAVRGLVLGGAGAAALVPLVGRPGWGALLAAVPFALAGWLAYRKAGYCMQGDYFVARWGIAGLYRALVPLHAVQAVLLRRSPFERAQGLARMTVFVAGGASVTVSHLPWEAAQGLVTDLGREAACRPFSLA
jgi:putative membrane protein